jgi:hypothetical protein
MKAFTATTLALALSVTPALAAAGPLAPGKPAGVHRADLGEGNTMLYIGAAALVAIGIVLATQGNDSGPTQPTNTVTGTSP